MAAHYKLTAEFDRSRRLRPNHGSHNAMVGANINSWTMAALLAMILAISYSDIRYCLSSLLSLSNKTTASEITRHLVTRHSLLTNLKMDFETGLFVNNEV